MNTHILRRAVSGKGMDETITPICSCGWHGIGYASHNDYQMTNVREQEIKHLHDKQSEVLARKVAA
jgi:hypothetical protein